MASRPPQAAAPSTNQRTASSDKPGASSSSTRQTDDEELRPFVLAGELGKGSFATVYKGYHEVRDTESMTRMGVDHPLLSLGDA